MYLKFKNIFKNFLKICDKHLLHDTLHTTKLSVEVVTKITHTAPAEFCDFGFLIF